MSFFKGEEDLVLVHYLYTTEPLFVFFKFY